VGNDSNAAVMQELWKVIPMLKLWRIYINNVSVLSSEHLVYVPGSVVYIYPPLKSFYKFSPIVWPSSDTKLVLFINWYTAKFCNLLSFVEVWNFTG
jgi:hypothetical protein